MSKKKMLMRKFGSVAVTNNTFIGGIAGVINTPALLAAKFLNYPSGTAFNEADIHNFTIVGDDIECYIGVDYQIIELTNTVKAVITRYVDKGRCKSVAGFNMYNTLNPKLIIHEFPVAVTVNSFCFTDYRLQNNPIAYIPLCTNLGGTVGLNYNFNIIRWTVYANPFLETCNAGSEDGDLALLRANGGTIRYVQNFTAPNPITNLSIGTVYATALQLNFTAPTGSTNAIDFYEVWVNGRYYSKITASGQYITGLTPNTVYNIEVKPVDIYYNKSSSNIVTQLTAATNPITTETTNFENRIIADGGILTNKTDINDEQIKLIVNSLDTNLLFWHNNMSGVKKDGSNFVEKLYSFTNANTDIIQLTQANKPLYTATGITFDTTDELTKTLPTSIVAPTFTIMFKVKAVPGNYYPLLAFQSWDAFNFHSATNGLIYAGNSVSVRFALGAGSLLNNVTATYTYTYNSTTKIAKIYRDTTLLGSMTQTDPIDRTSITINARNGTFYDAKMFNKDLSLTEITNIL